MRNMSFMLTTEQFKNRSKSVTRRLGWSFLNPGDRVMGVRKAMGLKPGEKMERLGPIEIVSVRKEPLDRITQEDCEREGFPDLRPSEFYGMFMAHMKCPQWQEVNRIEFRYLDATPGDQP